MNSISDLKQKLLNRIPLKIFSYLCRLPHMPHYGRETARALNVSIGAANQTLRLLHDLGLVSQEKKGQLYLYRVIPENPIVHELKKFENLVDLTELVLSIRDFCSKIVLYGSCATGEDTLESDIDLFIISGEKARVLNQIRKYTRRIEREIKPVIVSTEEYLSMRGKREVLIEEVGKGIVLWEKRR